MMMAQNNNQVEIEFRASTDEFKKGVKSINDDIKGLNDSFKLQQEQMKHTATVAEKMTATQEHLEAVQNKLADKVRLTSKAYQDAVDMYGANSDQARKLANDLKTVEIAQARNANAIHEASDALKSHKDAQSDINRLLSASGKSLDDYAATLGGDLVQAINSGRASTQQLQRAFTLMGQSAGASYTQVEELRNTLRQVNGNDTAELSREFTRLTTAIDETDNAAEELNGTLGSLASTGLDTIAGALSAGAIGMGAIGDDEIKTNIEASYKIDDTQLQDAYNTVSQLRALGLETVDALDVTRQVFSLNTDKSAEFNANVAASIASISQLYNMDANDMARNTYNLANALGVAQNEAVEFIETFLYAGGDVGEMLTVNEYAGFFKANMDMSVAEIQSLMQAATQSGLWDMSYGLDYIKEAFLRAPTYAGQATDEIKELIASGVSGWRMATAEEIESAEAMFDARVDNITAAQEEESAALQKMQQTASKQLAKQQQAASKNLEKALNAEVESVNDAYDARIKYAQDAAEAETKAYERGAKERTRAMEREHKRKMDILDAEERRQLGAIDADIKRIRDAQDAEDKALAAQERAEERAELVKAVNTARSTASRKKAQDALNEFDAQVARENLREQREMQIEALEAQKDTVSDKFAAEKEALAEQQNAEKEALAERLTVEREALAERQALTIEVLNEQKNAELATLQDVQDARREALAEQQEAEAEALAERQQAESDAQSERHEQEIANIEAERDARIKAMETPQLDARGKQLIAELEQAGTDILSGDADKTLKAMAKIDEIIQSVDDPKYRELLGQALGGTGYEEAGKQLSTFLQEAAKTQEVIGDGTYTPTSVDDTTAKPPPVSSGAFDPSTLGKVRDAVQSVNRELQPLYDIINNITQKVAQWIIDNPQITAILVQAILAVIAVLKVVMPIINGIIAVATKLFSEDSIIMRGIRLIRPALMAIGAVISGLSAPMWALIATVGAIVALIVLNIDTVKSVIATVADKVSDVASGIWSTLQGWYTSFTEWLSGVITWISDKISSIIGIISTVASSVADVLMLVWSTLSEWFSTALDWVLQKVQWVIDAIMSFFGTMGDVLGDLLRAPLNLFVDAYNYIIDRINEISIDAPDWLPLIGGQSWSIDLPNIEYFASGGIMPSAMVFGGSGNTAFVGGEAGREAIIPLTETVLADIGRGAVQAMGGGVSPQISVVVHANVADSVDVDVLAAKVAREIASKREVYRRGAFG